MKDQVKDDFMIYHPLKHRWIKRLGDAGVDDIWHLDKVIVRKK